MMLATSSCSLFSRPEMLVCLRANDDGGCVEEKHEVSVGRGYTVVIRGRDLPSRAVLELVRFEGERAVVLGTAPIEIGDRTHVTNPLLVPKVGTYRLTLRGTDGKALVRTNVRAPRPSVFGARNATPADRAAP